MQLSIACSGLVLHQDPVHGDDVITIVCDGKVHSIGFPFLRQARTLRVAEVAAIAQRWFFWISTLVAGSHALSVKAVAEGQAAAKRPKFRVMSNSRVEERASQDGLRAPV